jgi:hypothetical protein
MSEETASSIDVLTIYIPLLNEGTVVFRPTSAVRMGTNTYKVLPSPDYDPNLEEWAFPPGSIVEGSLETKGGKAVLVARAKAP